MKFASVILLFVLGSCQQMAPGESINSFPDIDKLLNGQVELLIGKTLTKKVSLEGESESKEWNLDSAQWVVELSFLNEINPNQPNLTGAFDMKETANQLTLSLKDSEKEVLKSIRITKSDDEITRLSAVVHESKDIFIHHRDIQLLFTHGMLTKYRIEGYQKILMKDTIKFRIEGSIDLSD